SIDPRTFNELSSAIWRMTASQAPCRSSLSPGCPERCGKSDPSHVHDACDRRLTSKSFRLKPQNREGADRVTVWPPDDSGTRHDHHRRARRKKNYMWKEITWLAARASSTGPRER